MGSPIERFEREAKLISQLKSPHTVSLFDFGRDTDDQLFMVLEFVEGETLFDVIQNAAPLSPGRCFGIVRQVLLSLAEAHDLGVLHRDVKPSNIMVFDHMDTTDNVKLLDFGVSKDLFSHTSGAALTAANDLVGTPAYMCPEYIRGEEMTPKADLYALGLICFELLTGKSGMEATAPLQILAEHLDASPIRLPEYFPQTVRAIVDGMLEKEPAARLSSAREVLEMIDTLAITK
jgi:serine/threonine-protein kinase